MRGGSGAGMHLSGDGSNRMTVAAVAVVAVPVRVARIEVQAVGAVRVRRTLRGRPVVAARTGAVEVVIPAVARRRQEDAYTVFLAGELATLDAVDRRPFVGAVVFQFFDLVTRRHHPRAAPFHVRHVVSSAGNVAADIMTVFLTAVAMGIGAPIILRFRLRLAPSVVITVAFGLVGSHVAARPFRAGGKAEVNHMWMIVVGAREIGRGWAVWGGWGTWGGWGGCDDGFQRARDTRLLVLVDGHRLGERLIAILANLHTMLAYLNVTEDIGGGADLLAIDIHVGVDGRNLHIEGADNHLLGGDGQGEEEGEYPKEIGYMSRFHRLVVICMQK